MTIHHVPQFAATGRSVLARISTPQGLWLPLSALLATLLLCPPASADPAQRLTVPLDGEPFDARLTGIDGQWNIALDRVSKRQELAASELVSWGARHDTARGPQILLADGGLLVADVLRLTGEHLVVGDPTGFGTWLFDDARLPLARVRGVLFQPPGDPLERDRLADRVMTAEGAEDQVLLDNGDLLGGLLLGLAGEEDQQIRLRMQAGEVTIPRQRIVALIFNPSLVQTARSQSLDAWMGFSDGTCLRVDQIGVENGQVRLTLPGAVPLKLDIPVMWSELVFVQPLGPHIVYLSDLKPIGYRHIPLLELSWPYGEDRNVLGGRLRHAGNIYNKGLGMHSTSRLAYELQGRYRQFQAELALDQRAGRRGSVVYRVLLQQADESGKPGPWNSAYQSPIVRGGDPPLPLRIDVTGAQRMALIVEFADRGDEWDHANWLNARLVPGE